MLRGGPMGEYLDWTGTISFESFPMERSIQLVCKMHLHGSHVWFAAACMWMQVHSCVQHELLLLSAGSCIQE